VSENGISKNIYMIGSFTDQSSIKDGNRKR